MASRQELDEIKNPDMYKHFVYVYKWYFQFYDEDDDSKKYQPYELHKLSISKNYKDLVTPILTGQFRFFHTDIQKIGKFQKRCLCTITCKMDSYISSHERGLIKYDTSIEFSSTFIPIFDPNTFKGKFSEQDLEKENDNIENGESFKKDNSPESPTRVIYITFFNLLAQRTLHIGYNKVIKSKCDVGGVILWVANQTAMNKYIIDKPSNTESLPYDVIIPPLNFVAVIKYIQSMYGIYDNGVGIWMDFDNTLYILNKYASEHDRESDDVPLTHIVERDIDEGGVGTLTRTENDDKEGVYVGNIPLINADDEILKGELEGHSFIFSSFYQSINSVLYDEGNEFKGSNEKVGYGLVRNTETHSSSGDKIICDYDELNNRFNMMSQFNETESLAKKITCSIMNAKIKDFNINKHLDLKFENIDKNNKYGGKYFIIGANFDFSNIPSSQISKEASDIEEEDLDGQNTKPFKTMCVASITISRRNPSETTEEIQAT